MKLISETDEHMIFLGYFQGKQVRVFKSKATGEVFFNMEDIAKVLGYASEEEMLKDPKVIENLSKADKDSKPTIIQTDSRNHIN